MTRLIFPLALLLVCLCNVAMAQSYSDAEPPHPFKDKPLAVRQIYADAAAQFEKWGDAPVPQGDYDSRYYQRTRLGTVSFAPGFRIHVDSIRDMVHFPSYYELIDARTGALLGKYGIFSPDEARWYFPGTGVAYLNQMNLNICGPRYTRKIGRAGKGLAEVVQPLVYVGEETEVVRPTPLFETPTSKNLVATVVPGSKVMVLGMQFGQLNRADTVLLVKTPFGLTGWHRAFGPEGALRITQCN